MAHLTDFTTAYITYRIGGDNGIGLSVMEDMAAVDIDDCVVDGKLNAFAQEIVDKLGIYAELSPSGTGVHIWGRAPNLLYDTTKYYMKNSEIGLEVYVGKHTTRFLTLTREAINDLDVNDCSEALQELLDTRMVRPTAQAPSVEAPGSFLSDDSVVAKMLSDINAETTKALWEGQIPEGKSHSEADMSLCMILAFWCGGDA